MKYFVIFSIIIILFMPQVFAEESFNGNSSVDPPLSEIVSGKSTILNIKFQYTSDPYSMKNFNPVIEIAPSNAEKFVQIEVDPVEITRGQTIRIPVTITVDPRIEHEKIFLSISFTGNHFQTNEFFKSSWNDQVTLDVIMSNNELYPEPEQVVISEKCGEGTTIQDGICVANKSDETMTSDKWPSPYQNIELSPLKQFKFGIPFHEIKCNSGLQLTQRYDGYPACVNPDTYFELIKRNWVSNIIKAVQSRDFSDIDPTSSYMEKIIPTLDEFKETLSKSPNIETIFSKFGTPHNDFGSGIHIYVYDLNDSTQVWIGYTDQIWYVRHVDSDGNVLEKLFEENEN